MGICIISRFAFVGRFTGGGVPVTLCCLALSPYETLQRRRPVRILSMSAKKADPLPGHGKGPVFLWTWRDSNP